LGPGDGKVVFDGLFAAIVSGLIAAVMTFVTNLCRIAIDRAGLSKRIDADFFDIM
jgi:hypothetical protein